MGQKEEEEEKKEREGRKGREKEMRINVLFCNAAIISFHSGMCAEGNFREAFVYAKCYASQCNVGRLVARWLV